MGGKGIITLLILLPLINLFYISDIDITDNRTAKFDLQAFADYYPEPVFDDAPVYDKKIIEYEKKLVRTIVYQYRHSLIDTNINELTALIVNISKKHGISPKFIASVIGVESSFNPYAISHMDAMGLMQITPDTAEYLNNKYRVIRSGEIDLFENRTNIELGVLYIRELISRYGNVKKAMAAYNFGPGRIDHFITHNKSIPAKYYNDINNVMYTL